MPVKMFAIAALGLVVAGIVLRVMMKISTARRQRTTIDRHDFDRTTCPQSLAKMRQDDVDAHQLAGDIAPRFPGKARRRQEHHRNGHESTRRMKRPPGQPSG